MTEKPFTLTAGERAAVNYLVDAIAATNQVARAAGNDDFDIDGAVASAHAFTAWAKDALWHDWPNTTPERTVEVRSQLRLAIARLQSASWHVGQGRDTRARNATGRANQYLCNAYDAMLALAPELRCGCESSLCDHDGACQRQATGHVQMEYVVHTCATCAANMAVTGGADYLHLTN